MKFVISVILNVVLAGALIFSVVALVNAHKQIAEKNEDMESSWRHEQKQKKVRERLYKENEDAQDQAETAYANLHRTQQQLAEQKQRVGQLQRVHSLKVAEYEAFVAKAAQALAAKDKKISELSAPVK